eukprot:scaffold192_cov126-Isochrysis_galbana.AAC.2
MSAQGDVSQAAPRQISRARRCDGHSKTAPADVPACGFGGPAGLVAGALATPAAPFTEDAAAAVETTAGVAAGTEDDGSDWTTEHAFLGCGGCGSVAVFWCLEPLPQALAPAKSSSLDPFPQSADLTSRVVPLLRPLPSAEVVRSIATRELPRPVGGSAQHGTAALHRTARERYF